jgi:DNA replication and repair protein RecF
VPVETELVLRHGEGKVAKLNGVRLRAAEQLRTELAALVFTPDRLAVVKGGPAARRAYFDRVLGRLSPARAPLPAEYGAAIAQRNAALRRVAAGFSSRDALAPWTASVAELGARLVAARRDAVDQVAPRFAERADELGLAEGALRYDAEPPTEAALEARLDRDLDRGFTGLGPHLDDVGVLSGERDLRVFGSQGEQRLAVLSLLLGEADLLAERSPSPPLLLLDDVLSELDPARRKILAGRISGRGQALVTATSAASLPAEPDLVLEVSPSSGGSVVRRA